MLYHWWATETTVSAESEGLGFDSSWGLRSFSFSLARDKKKNTILYFFAVLKTYHISYSDYKHDAIDVANPSSMQDACHMNFVIDFANRSLCGLVVEYRSAEFEGLTFASSWGLRKFLFPTLVTRRKAPFSKNSYFHISLVEVEQRRDTIIFLRTFMLCLFLNWHLQWGQFPSSPLLCQESFCFTNIRSARYVDNTGTENQCQYEFSHFPVTVPTYNGSPLILILYDLSFRFTQNGIICRLPVFRLLSDENIMELKEICH